MVLQDAGAARMLREPAGDVVDFSVDDDPAVFLRLVASHLLPREVRQLGQLALGRVWSHRISLASYRRKCKGQLLPS